MKTALDCVPCFFKQALDAAVLAKASRGTQKKILFLLSKQIKVFDFNKCPTAMGEILYKLVRKTTGNNDPFKKIKKKSNVFALSLYPRLKQKVTDSKDRLLVAIELSIAGNIIDYGVKHAININKEIEKIFAKEDKIIRGERKTLFDYPAFKKALKRAKKILYIGDNAGEIVFDRILLEEFEDKDVVFAVRAEPVINDVLKEDAYFCGINKYAKIISTGCAAPGAILKHCSTSFRKVFKAADLIISKGQGNFEALTNESGPIFFLFRAKCPVVVRHLRCNLGDILLKKQK